MRGAPSSPSIFSISFLDYPAFILFEFERPSKSLAHSAAMIFSRSPFALTGDR